MISSTSQRNNRIKMPGPIGARNLDRKRTVVERCVVVSQLAESISTPAPNGAVCFQSHAVCFFSHNCHDRRQVPHVVRSVDFYRSDPQADGRITIARVSKAIGPPVPNSSIGFQSHAIPGPSPDIDHFLGCHSLENENSEHQKLGILLSTIISPFMLFIADIGYSSVRQNSARRQLSNVLG